MALLTKGEEVCPKGEEQFRVRCLQPLSHPSATRILSDRKPGESGRAQDRPKSPGPSKTQIQPASLPRRQAQKRIRPNADRKTQRFALPRPPLRTPTPPAAPGPDSGFLAMLRRGTRRSCSPWGAVVAPASWGWTPRDPTCARREARTRNGFRAARAGRC
jgi:hypothetical protein